jgi:aminoglycoside phosphotransferase
MIFILLEYLFPDEKTRYAWFEQRTNTLPETSSKNKHKKENMLYNKKVQSMEHGFSQLKHHYNVEDLMENLNQETMFYNSFAGWDE